MIIQLRMMSGDGGIFQIENNADPCPMQLSHEYVKTLSEILRERESTCDMLGQGEACRVNESWSLFHRKEERIMRNILSPKAYRSKRQNNERNRY